MKTDAISRLIGVRLASDAAPSGQHIGSTPLAAARMINAGRIIPDLEQPRKTFPDDELNLLAASIEAHGQRVPVIVRWDAPLDRFVIVDGKRRWRAAQRTKTTTALFAIVDNRHMTPDQLFEMQLVTNALRDDVPPMEAATAYRMLMRIWELNQNQLAARLHISAAKVSRALALLDLLAEVQVAVEEGKVGASVAVRAARKKPASKSKKPNTVRLSCDAGTAVVTVKPGKTVGDFLATLIEQERRRAA
jgi:ParB family chromosome partitioning protein